MRVFSEINDLNGQAAGPMTGHNCRAGNNLPGSRSTTPARNGRDQADAAAGANFSATPFMQ